MTKSNSHTFGNEQVFTPATTPEEPEYMVTLARALGPLPDTETGVSLELAALQKQRLAEFYAQMPVFGNTFTPFVDEGQLPSDLRGDFSDTWYGR